MGFEETGELLWSEMSITERVNFLKALAKATRRQPKWWGRLSPEAIARIPSFDNLPGDLRGRLIIAMTEEGFSIKENARVQKIMEGKANSPGR